MSLVIESKEIGGVVMEVPTPTIIASAPLELVLAVSLGLLVLLIIGICFSDPPLASMTALEGAARPTRKAATTLPPEKNTINGERYDRSLIELAQTLRAAKSNFTLGRPDAVKLWQDAKDGPGVTDTERKTLAFIRDMYGMTAEAKSFLTAQIEVTPSGSSYYATIPGRLRGEPSTVVDRAMWDEISMLARDGNIDLADARKLWAAAQDGPGVTTTERRTMERALKDHNFTRGARDFLERQLASLGSE